MYVFSSISEILDSFDPVQVVSRVFADPAAQDGLIDAITLRLQEKGVTASGKKLETDAAIKQDAGKVYSQNNYLKGNNRFVDLFDSGDFYDSFNIKSNEKSFSVSAEFSKEDNENIFDNFSLSFTDSDEFYTEILTPIRDEYFEDVIIEDFAPVFIEITIKFFQDAIKGI